MFKQNVYIFNSIFSFSVNTMPVFKQNVYRFNSIFSFSVNPKETYKFLTLAFCPTLQNIFSSSPAAVSPSISTL